MTLTVNKEDAKELLQINKGNREIEEERIREYEKEMNRGNWILGGSPLEIKEGIFKNGQHRLHAFLRSELNEITFHVKIG